MGAHTDIGWCDSTVNLAMGCDGCELSARKGFGTCYAESLTDRHAGRSTGYPTAFYEPKLYTHRLDEALRWKDMTGTERPDKPWLNGRPRHVFHGDMGDYFTESLPLDWLAPFVSRMADSPHVWIFLTKRPSRMRKFWNGFGPVPRNFILMTSVTGPKAQARVAEIAGIPDCVRGLSCEPLLEPLMIAPRGLVQWVITGGESGARRRACKVEWFESLAAECGHAGVPFFMKQDSAFKPGQQRRIPPELWARKEMPELRS